MHLDDAIFRSDCNIIFTSTESGMDDLFIEDDIPIPKTIGGDRISLTKTLGGDFDKLDQSVSSFTETTDFFSESEGSSSSLVVQVSDDKRPLLRSESMPVTRRSKEKAVDSLLLSTHSRQSRNRNSLSSSTHSKNERAKPRSSRRERTPPRRERTPPRTSKPRERRSMPEQAMGYPKVDRQQLLRSCDKMSVKW